MFWRGGRSVSYTHLDVYKRQAKVQAKGALAVVAADLLALTLLKPCLLYTSRCV